MMNHVQKNARGVVIVHITSEAESIPGYEATAETADVVGKKWDGAKWVDGRTKAEKALAKLMQIDIDSGMSRALRETMISIGKVDTPQAVKDYEAAAVVARADLGAVD